jgi:hypothetical protein
MSLPNIAGQMGQCGGASMEKTAMKKTPSSKSQLGKKKKLPLALSGTMNRYFFLSVIYLFLGEVLYQQVCAFGFVH